MDFATARAMSVPEPQGKSCASFCAEPVGAVASAGLNWAPRVPAAALHAGPIGGTEGCARGSSLDKIAP